MESAFDIIRKEGRLLFEYIRGSQLYGLATENSDIDTGGVFICKPEEALGILEYPLRVSDERQDNFWYEISEFAKLAIRSNPNILEALFVPEDKIIGEVHPWFQLFIDNRDKFITKECFNSFYGYAKSQIEKARGLKKKFVNPIEKRLTPLDFCYKSRESGGSELVVDFLREHGMYQKYCGLTALDHMHESYCLYYDWGAQFKDGDINSAFLDTFNKFLGSHYDNDISAEFHEPKHYRGIIDEKYGNELRLSEIPKSWYVEYPICTLVYNASGYSRHCREYKEYKEWEKMRNPVRYSTNLEHNIDSKNMCHCFRLIHMAKEIAEGKGVILERTWDKQFLLDVKSHKYDYTELMDRLEQEREEMKLAMENSSIPETVDKEFVNNLITEIRFKQLRNNG